MTRFFLKKSLIGGMLIALALNVTASAQSGYSYGKRSGGNGSGGKGQDQMGLTYPVDNDPAIASFPPQWKENKFILNMSEEVAEDVANKYSRYQKIMTNTYDMDLLMKPITKPFRSIDQIYITSEFTTTIMFPSKYTIYATKSSTPLPLEAYASNVLTIQPARDFVQGNIVVSLTTGNENAIMNIIIKRYLPGMEKKNINYEIKYAGDKQFVSTVIVYKDLPKVPTSELLETYFKLFGETISDSFYEDCKFDVYDYDGITYYIIRDDKFGNIEYNGINYRIANEYEGCGEYTGMSIRDDDGTLK